MKWLRDLFKAKFWMNGPEGEIGFHIGFGWVALAVLYLFYIGAP